MAMMVVGGHCYNIEALTTWGEDNVDMKLSTAICFVCISSHLLHPRKIALISAMAFVGLSVLMGYIIPAGEPVSNYTVSYGLPSLGTLALFVVVIAGLNKGSRLAGKVVIGFSILAFIGYLFSVPALYFYFDGISTGMAVHTAILFIHLGFHLYNKDKLESVRG